MPVIHALWNFKDAPAHTRLLWELDNGFDGASLLFYPQFAMKNAAELASFRSVVTERKPWLTCHGAFGEADSSESVPNYKFHMKRAIAFHEETGLVRAYVFDPAYIHGGDKDVFAPDETFKGLETALKIFKSSRIPIAVENWRVNSDFAFFEGVKKHFGNSVAMLLDIGHIHLAVNDASSAWHGLAHTEVVNRLPLKFLEVHVHNNDGVTDQHAPLTSGTMPYNDVLKAVAKKGVVGCYTVEHGGSFSDEQVLGNVAESCRLVREHAGVEK
jgi:sugar phosphate isomerase/epimerase